MTAATTPQHMKALHQANATRAAMREIKRDIRGAGGRFRAAQYLLDPPDALARLEVSTFLQSIHRIGPRKAVDLLRAARLPASSMVWRVGPLYETWTDGNKRTLTTRQRLELVAVLKRPSHHAD